MEKETKVIKLMVLFFILCMVMIIGIYILNFRSNPISNNPSDWGVLGDYFGGILNPLISLITLSFLIKTYLYQKKETIQGQSAADEQRSIAQKTARIQLLNTKISARYDAMTFYKSEMDGVTNAMASNRRYTSIYGDEYDSDREQKKYRLDMADKIKMELEKINESLKEIESLSD